ncbi:hypothetical protein VULLAG_LOCUS13925 [Vulpes lagopus]
MVKCSLRDTVDRQRQDAFFHSPPKQVLRIRYSGNITFKLCFQASIRKRAASPDPQACTSRWQAGQGSSGDSSARRRIGHGDPSA